MIAVSVFESELNAMATLIISLPDSMRDWVESQVESGSYANHSDYLRDLIRKDQLRVQRHQAMQQAISQGIESGEARVWNKEEFKASMKQKLRDADL